MTISPISLAFKNSKKENRYRKSQAEKERIDEILKAKKEEEKKIVRSIIEEGLWAVYLDYDIYTYARYPLEWENLDKTFPNAVYEMLREGQTAVWATSKRWSTRHDFDSIYFQLWTLEVGSAITITRKEKIEQSEVQTFLDNSITVIFLTGKTLEERGEMLVEQLREIECGD